MNPILEAAVEVERIVRATRFPFCFIGGIAVQRWGQPRMTADIDLTVITGFGDEERHVDVLLASLGGRLSDARSFALRHRTLLLVASNGVHVDVSLGAMPFEERSVERASLFAISDRDSITTCSAEDLIVHKAFAGRDKDWGDIRGIVARQSHLDRRLIWDESRACCAGTSSGRTRTPGN
ncbi:MAG TPA: nucleotidyl transferase AbiEii/AbiGii toxin family protein [Kofleriaceae bacterium]|nr:nucleotidyl transferase AbiEii/AbiGii toxin family protein [Kofleriaceae bacterium]